WEPYRRTDRGFDRASSAAVGLAAVVAAGLLAHAERVGLAGLGAPAGLVEAHPFGGDLADGRGLGGAGRGLAAGDDGGPREAVAAELLAPGGEGAIGDGGVARVVEDRAHDRLGVVELRRELGGVVGGA